MAEIIVHEDQNAMPTTSETLEDFTSNLSPENAEPAVSKSRTSSLGKMFQKMRLSEVRSKIKKEGGHLKEKISDEIAKTSSATVSTESSYKQGFRANESVEVLDNHGTKSGLGANDSVQNNGTLSNKGIRNYLGSWNACWQKPPNSDDISENEYHSPEVVNEQSICANCDIATDDVLKEVPLRPMSATNANAEK